MANEPTAAKVYIVTSGSYSDFAIRRVYLDRVEADAFVEARNKAYDSEGYDVEEWPVGGPQAEYDGLIWEGVFRQHYQPSAKDQLTFRDLAVRRGGYFEYFAPQPQYTGKLLDKFDYHEVWHTGEMPPKAHVHYTSLTEHRDTIYACVRGISREHVEKSLQDTVARLKAEKAGIA